MRIDPSKATTANRGKMAVYDERLKKSPLRPLIEAGLYQSIVTDVENESRVNQHLEKIYTKFGDTTKIPEGLKDVMRNIAVTPSTDIYKAMHMLATSTDITARYALYTHLMKGSNKLTAEQREAKQAEVIRVVRDSYVDYNLPTNRFIQSLDDYGIVPFSKYYMRMNKVYLQLAKDSPGKLLQLHLANSFASSLDTVNSSTMLSKIATNSVITPFSLGGSWRSLVTLQLAGSLIPH